eukprot:5506440-Prorocentrum_lima.AAC.1
MPHCRSEASLLSRHRRAAIAGYISPILLAAKARHCWTDAPSRPDQEWLFDLGDAAQILPTKRSRLTGDRAGSSWRRPSLAQATAEVFTQTDAPWQDVE